MTDNPPGYLENLIGRLILGLAQLDESTRRPHRDYLIRRQNRDGGFSGREGGSDLYYTSFALRSLACLGELTDSLLERTADFLRSQLQSSASVVDFMSLLYTANLVAFFDGPDVLNETGVDWQSRVARELESFRKEDGGYAKAAETPSSSTYHTFLVMLCYELLDRQLPDPTATVQFLLSRQREDGGFVEVGPALRGGTNPTAAAMAVLLKYGAVTAELNEQVATFLSRMQAADGGLRANGRAPLPDLLSSFTGLLTLLDLETADRIDPVQLANFVSRCVMEEGGFRGGMWDSSSDVEYTFYGLGTVALLKGIDGH